MYLKRLLLLVILFNQYGDFAFDDTNIASQVLVREVSFFSHL